MLECESIPEVKSEFVQMGAVWYLLEWLLHKLLIPVYSMANFGQKVYR